MFIIIELFRQVIEKTSTPVLDIGYIHGLINWSDLHHRQKKTSFIRPDYKSGGLTDEKPR